MNQPEKMKMVCELSTGRQDQESCLASKRKHLIK